MESELARKAFEGVSVGLLVSVVVAMALRAGHPSISLPAYWAVCAPAAAAVGVCVGVMEGMRYRADVQHYHRERAREEW